MKTQTGKCALCGKEGKLTFEHIPPRAAFNSNRARPVGGKEIFKEEVLNDDNSEVIKKSFIVLLM